MEEKLVVEFGVEKEIERDYGYVEKYLTHNSESTPYKAIVKNGELLAIVSRRYKLIENERVIEICKEISDALGFDMDYYVSESKTRVHIFLYADDKGVVVHNSVDGSYAFRLDAVVRLSETVNTIIGVKNVEQVYKKHFGSLEVAIDDLSKIIKEILDKAEEFRYFIHKLDTMKVADYLEELKTLEDLLPKKYVVKALRISTQRSLTGDAVTLKNLYERIASDIWTAQIDMKTKVQYFNNLNQLMFAVAGWET